MQVDNVNVLKAWVVYYLLKCALVISAMYIGERLGFFAVSIAKGPSLREGVAMPWVVWGVYFFTLAAIATFLFKWAVGRFVVSKMAQEVPVRLSLFLYSRIWLVYASVTFAVGYLITLVLEYTILELMLVDMAEAPWAGWLRVSMGPIVFTAVSLVVFRWAVVKLLLADRAVAASRKSEVM